MPLHPPAVDPPAPAVHLRHEQRRPPPPRRPPIGALAGRHALHGEVRVQAGQRAVRGPRDTEPAALGDVLGQQAGTRSASASEPAPAAGCSASSCRCASSDGVRPLGRRASLRIRRLRMGNRVGCSRSTGGQTFRTSTGRRTPRGPDRERSRRGDAASSVCPAAPDAARRYADMQLGRPLEHGVDAGSELLEHRDHTSPAQPVTVDDPDPTAPRTLRGPEVPRSAMTAPAQPVTQTGCTSVSAEPTLPHHHRSPCRQFGGRNLRGPSRHGTGRTGPAAPPTACSPPS